MRGWEAPSRKGRKGKAPAVTAGLRQVRGRRAAPACTGRPRLSTQAFNRPTRLHSKSTDSAGRLAREHAQKRQQRLSRRLGPAGQADGGRAVASSVLRHCQCWAEVPRRGEWLNCPPKRRDLHAPGAGTGLSSATSSAALAVVLPQI